MYLLAILYSILAILYLFLSCSAIYAGYVNGSGQIGTPDDSRTTQTVLVQG